MSKKSSGRGGGGYHPDDYNKKKPTKNSKLNSLQLDPSTASSSQKTKRLLPAPATQSSTQSRTSSSRNVANFEPKPRKEEPTSSKSFNYGQQRDDYLRLPRDDNDDRPWMQRDEQSSDYVPYRENQPNSLQNYLDGYKNSSNYHMYADTLIKALQDAEVNFPKLEKYKSKKVVCSSAKGPHDFCLQWVVGEYQLGLQLLTEWLKRAVKKTPEEDKKLTESQKQREPLAKITQKECAVDAFVAVPYRTLDGIIWSRGKIMEILPNEYISVHLVDYGNEKILPRRLLYKLPPGIEQVKPFCFRVRLHDYKEDPDHHLEANRFFMKCMAAASVLNCILEKLGKESKDNVICVSLSKIDDKMYNTIQIHHFLNRYMECFSDDVDR